MTLAVFSSQPASSVMADSAEFLAAEDADHGRELWRRAATDDGAARVADLNDGPNDSRPAYLQERDGAVYFTAFDGNDRELWKFEKQQVTQLDITPDSDSFAGGLTVIDDVLYFRAWDGHQGYDVWKTDGTAECTTRHGNSHVVVGDANLDGTFDSSDLVQVLQAGEFEDGTQSNSGFQDGDWNGDAEFTTGDLTFAFQAGTYESEIVDDDNAPPTVSETSLDYSLEEDSSLYLSSDEGLLQYAADDDGDFLAVEVVDHPTSGFFSAPFSGSFFYDPEPDFFGTDSFTYRVSDGQATSGLVSVDLNVTPVNDLPQAENDLHYQVDQNESLIFDPLTQFSDAEGDDISIATFDGPEQGQFTKLADGGYSYTPPPGFYGTVQSTVILTDGTEQTAPLPVTISVRPTDTSPVAQNVTYEMQEDHTLIVQVENGLTSAATDADGDEIIAGFVPQNPGSSIESSDRDETAYFQYEGDGSFVFIPQTDFSGELSFEYHVIDEDLNQSNTAIATIIVHPVFDAPLPNDDTFETAEDKSITLDPNEQLLANDTLGEIDTSLKIIEQPEHGTLERITRDDETTAWQYTPRAGFLGTDAFQYTLTDGSTDYGSATAQIEVTPRGVIQHSDNVVTVYGSEESDRVRFVPTAKADVIKVLFRNQSRDITLVEQTFDREAVSKIVYYGYAGQDHFENRTNINSEAYGGNEPGDGDVLIGGSGHDVLWGNAGGDHLDGGRGDDLLYGGTGSDSLSGGQGHDTLDGEMGNDRYTLADAALYGYPLPSAREGYAAHLTVDDHGALYATDGEHSVWKYERNDAGSRAAFRRFTPDGGQEARAPASIDFGPDGNLYVASMFDRNVRVYDGETGEFLNSLWDNQPTTQLQSDNGVMRFGPEGLLYIADFNEFNWSDTIAQIRRFDTQTETFLESRDNPLIKLEAETSRDEFYPHDITFDSQGNLYVAYHSQAESTRRIERYDSQTGDPLPAAGEAGAILIQSEELALDASIAIGPDGNLLATAQDGTIRSFDSETGDPLGIVAPGDSTLAGDDLAVGPDGTLYRGPHQGVVRAYTLTQGQVEISDAVGQNTIALRGLSQGTSFDLSKTNHLLNRLLRLTVASPESFTILEGSRYDDRLVGHKEIATRLSGSDGNDILIGGDEADRLIGGSGNDTLRGHGSGDTLRGNSGDDKLSGGDGADTLDGGFGEDEIRGGDGIDMLTRDDEEDLDGEPIEYSKSHTPTRFGKYMISIEINGTDQDDRASVDVVTLAGKSKVVVELNGETFQFEEDEAWVDIRFDGGAGDDYFADESDNNPFGVRAVGGPGDDRLVGGPGSDFLYGGTGRDRLEGRGGNDGLYAVAQFGVENTPQAARNILIGGAGDDDLYGAATDDTLQGGAGYDTLVGRLGNDTLEGGPGDDILRGGRGGDTYVFRGSSLGLDEITEARVNFDTLDFSEFDHAIDLDLGKSSLQTVADEHLELILSSSRIERVIGTVASDRVKGSYRREVLRGMGGDDTLLGGRGNDSIYGGPGDDHLEGGWGNDRLYGNEGNDSLIGNRNNDRLIGGVGADVLLGGNGHDTLKGGDETGNIMLGGAGADEIFSTFSAQNATDDREVIFDSDGMNTFHAATLPASWLLASDEQPKEVNLAPLNLSVACDEDAVAENEKRAADIMRALDDHEAAIENFNNRLDNIDQDIRAEAQRARRRAKQIQDDFGIDMQDFIDLLHAFLDGGGISLLAHALAKVFGDLAGSGLHAVNDFKRTITLSKLVFDFEKTKSLRDTFVAKKINLLRELERTNETLREQIACIAEREARRASQQNDNDGGLWGDVRKSMEGGEWVDTIKDGGKNLSEWFKNAGRRISHSSEAEAWKRLLDDVEKTLNDNNVYLGEQDGPGEPGGPGTGPGDGDCDPNGNGDCQVTGLELRVGSDSKNSVVIVPTNGLIVF